MYFGSYIHITGLLHPIHLYFFNFFSFFFSHMNLRMDKSPATNVNQDVIVGIFRDFR